MRRWRYQRGDVPVGCLVGGVVAVIVVLVAIKVAPIMIHVVELDKEISNLADRANRREYTDQRIRHDILEKAELLDLPVTKKPLETRMGKGKGGVEYWVAQIQPGRMLFEMEGVSEELAREAFQLAAAKLPVATTFVTRTVM